MRKKEGVFFEKAIKGKGRGGKGGGENGKKKGLDHGVFFVLWKRYLMDRDRGLVGEGLRGISFFSYVEFVEKSLIFFIQYKRFRGFLC